MDLLRNYPAGYNVLPTANPHDVVNITLQMALYHIVDMVRLRLSEREISMIFQNERAQTMTTNCEVITKWHDVFLMWNPDDYDNIRDTRHVNLLDNDYDCCLCLGCPGSGSGPRTSSSTTRPGTGSRAGRCGPSSRWTTRET